MDKNYLNLKAAELDKPIYRIRTSSMTFHKQSSEYSKNGISLERLASSSTKANATSRSMERNAVVRVKDFVRLRMLL